MNRKSILATSALYLSLLSLVTLSLFLISFLPRSPFRLGFMIGLLLLFVILSYTMQRWVIGIRAIILTLTQALKSPEERHWAVTLPPIDIEEMWSWISALHHARESFREKLSSLEGEKQKLFQILSNLKEGILVADPANKILMVNEGAQSLLYRNPEGNPIQEFSEMSLESFVDGEFKSVFLPLARGEEKSGMLFIPERDLAIAFRSFPLKSSEGELIAKVAVLHDITQSKKIEEMRRAFVANASHELRSPIASLQALLDAFEIGGLDDLEQRQKFIGMMGREIKRLNLIIRDLLDLSELEREKEFSKEPIKIANLFLDCLQSYETQAKQKPVQIQTHFKDPETTLYGSTADIEKLFRNLLDNALKFTSSGGSIEIGLEQTNGHLLGWVKDSGPGIPKEHLERIFERFYRVDQSRSRALGGTGLGLSIAKHAVERHGGKIWAESSENQGSAFYFTLPLTTLY